MARDSTIVLLTLNEIDGLTQLFEEIPRDAYKRTNAEDGGSTDGTRAFLEARQVLLDQPIPGRGVAFRVAAEATDTERLVFYGPDGNEDPADISLDDLLLEGAHCHCQPLRGGRSTRSRRPAASARVNEALDRERCSTLRHRHHQRVPGASAPTLGLDTSVSAPIEYQIPSGHAAPLEHRGAGWWRGNAGASQGPVRPWARTPQGPLQRAAGRPGARVSDDPRVRARRAAIDALVAEHFPMDPSAAPPADRLPLALPTFGAAEVAEAIDSLLSGWVTMGAKVRAFEERFAAWVGAEHAVMVNSGSSALLVMLSALVEQGQLRPGQEVLVPAVGWSTSLFSAPGGALARAGGRGSRQPLPGGRPRPAGPAGAPAGTARRRAPHPRGRLRRPAPPSRRRVGSTATPAASPSSSPTTHTIEGGMVVIGRPPRGPDAQRPAWLVERTDRTPAAATPTPLPLRLGGLQRAPHRDRGAFGLHQLDRIDDIVAPAPPTTSAVRGHRRAGPLRTFPARPGTTHAGFGFPFVLDADAPATRAEVSAHLESRGVQTRAISGSNLARQPAVAHLPRLRVEGPLPVADAVHDRGLFVGQGHTFTDAQLDLLCAALTEVLRP